MDALVVTRWRKYGKDRLYVNLVDSDARVGWLDLVSGAVVIERHDLAANFTAAVDEYRMANRLTLVAVGAPAAEATRPDSGAPAPLIHVERWRKFGKDRLYVTAVGGERLGWVDLRSGLTTIEQGASAELVREALHDHCAQYRITLPDLTEPSSSRPAAAEQAWADLAQNKAGEAAHEQALNEYAKWQRGAEAEVVVGASLDSLASEGWHTLHAVPIGDRGADIDHVVIGPGGVFTVNTKNHLGHTVNVTAQTFKVDRRRTRYVSDSRLEAQRAGYLLSQAIGELVTVTPLIVVVADGLNVTAQPDGVHVLGRGEVDTWLSTLPVTFQRDAVDTIWDQARRSTTWQPHN